ncbi:Chitinase B [Staphylococcus aureus]|uniref:Chitinase B n=1 Tax=Staphylococcus aureus TaxID=1280 RepID=A0A380EI88_STAAU|nr:Chitinase B [Staphylococcus aureus]
MNKLLQSLSALGVSATLVTPNLNADATTNTTPQIKGANDIVIKKGQDYNLLNGISAFDKEDGDLTDKIKSMAKLIHPNLVNIKLNIMSLIQMVQLKFPLGILRLNSPHHYTANKMVANEHVLLPFYLLF